MTGAMGLDAKGVALASADKSRTTVFSVVLTGLSAIAGLLFGYDTGVVSGAMLLIGKQMNLDTLWHELIVSGTIAAAWLFSLFGGFAADRFGRKATIMAAAVVFTMGSAIMGLATGKEMLLGGRIVVGIGVGLASMSTPVYIAESSAPRMRGILVTVYTLGVTFGQFVAGIVCGVLAEVFEGWRYMLGIAAVPSLILLVGMIFMPESPRWLISRGRSEDAERVLQRLRGRGVSVKEEVRAIQENCDETNKHLQGNKNVLWEILRTKHTRRALFLGCSLQAFQQLAGINTVMYYSASIIQMAGIGDHSTAIWLAAGVAGVNFVCTFIGMYLIERVGRRPLALGSLLGVVFSLILLGVGFLLMESDSPHVTWETGPQGTCGGASLCSDCIASTLNCGFCFTALRNNSCWALEEHSQEAQAGPCMTPAAAGTSWAVGWCPSEYSWIAILALVVYLVFFSPGMGSVPWIVNSEVYPLWARGFSTSMATSINWLFNMVISMTFLTLLHVLTTHGAFFLYAGITFVGFVLLFFIMPETKGISLEDMEALFSGQPVKSKPEPTKETSNGH